MSVNSTASRETLERRLAKLSEEIRNYPGPIARCDEQLADLLERRAQVLEALKQTQSKPSRVPGCSATAIWINDGGFDAA